MSELREFIRKNPKDPETIEARNRIAELEFRSAKEANTRYAFNSFLERHPVSSQALDARIELEQLDFEVAKKAGSSEALATFLRQHPAGRFAENARSILDSERCALWTAAEDRASLVAFLKRNRDLSCTDQLEDRLRQLRLAHALETHSPRLLMDYVETYSKDQSVARARHVLLDLWISTLLEGARFDSARAILVERSGADHLDAWLDKVEQAREDWVVASFDHALITRLAKKNADPDLNRLANHFRNHGRFVGPLAAASRKIRGLMAKRSSVDGTERDPRQRWLWMTQLGQTADEESANLLLSHLGDPFLEVRRRALKSLSAVVVRLGPVLGPIWLSEQRNRLAKTARSGILLFKLAVLNSLSGDDKESLIQLIDLTGGHERPDLLALHSAVGLSTEQGHNREAASLAVRFCTEASAFADQRTAVWEDRVQKPGRNNGRLMLRQLHGLIVLWRDLLVRFLPGPNGKPAQRDHRSMLGPWLEESQQSLTRLESWFRDEEKRWSLQDREYQSCGAPSSLASRPSRTEVRDSVDGVMALATGGGRLARPVLRWSACCHPEPTTRRVAGQLRTLTELLLQVTPFPASLGQ